MSIPKTMFFIDGENLVFRYQAMLAEGRTPSAKVIHVPDVFVWHPQLTQTSYMNVARVNYYTSMVGDDKALNDLRRRIGRTAFDYDYAPTHSGNAFVVPFVFKKPAKSHKSRQVDIQIVIDMMRFAHNPSIDLLCLVSGDGDFVPLLDEVMRRGKEVYVAALSSGCATQVTWCSDEFIDLDRLFFPPPKAQKKQS